MLKSLSQTSLGTILSLTANLIALPYLARTISTESYGHFFFIFTSALILGNTLLWGAAPIYLQCTENEEPLLIKETHRMAALGLISSLPLMLSFLYLKKFNFYLALFVFFGALTQSYGQLASSQLIKKGRFLWHSVNLFLLSGLTPILQCYLVAATKKIPDHLTLLNAFTVSNFASLILFFYLHKTKLISFDTKGLVLLKSNLSSKLKEQTNKATWSFIISLLRPRVIFYTLNSSTALGIYSQIERFTSAPTSVTQTTLRPLAGRYFGRKGTVDKQVFALIYTCLVLIVPILAGLLIWTPQISNLLLGHQNADTVSLFRMLLISGTLMMCLSWADTIFIQLKKQRQLFIFELSSLALIVIISGSANLVASSPISLTKIFVVSLTLHYLFYFCFIGFHLNQIKAIVLLKTIALIFLLAVCYNVGLLISAHPLVLTIMLFTLSSLCGIIAFRMVSRDEKTIFILTNSEESLLGHRSKYIKWLSTIESNIYAVGPFESDQSKEFSTGCGITILPTKLKRKNINPFIELKDSLNYFLYFIKFRPSVVHAFTLKAIIQALLIGRITNVPKIICSVTGLGYIFISNDFKARAVRFVVTRMISTLADSDKVQFIFQNEDDLNLFISLKIIDKSQANLILGSGIDIHKFSYTPPVRKNSNLIGLFGGRLLKDKGLIELFGASKQLADKNIPVEIWIAGTLDPQNPNSLTENDLERAKSIGNIRFLGQVLNMKDVIKDCDFSILPSYREGLSMFLLESMASGKPIITTDAPGCRQIIDSNKVNGFVVPVKNPDGLAAAIEELCLSPEKIEIYSKNSRALAEEKYSEDIIFQQIHSTYRGKLPITSPLH